MFRTQHVTQFEHIDSCKVFQGLQDDVATGRYGEGGKGPLLTHQQDEQFDNKDTCIRYLESYMTPLQLEGVLGGHVVLLQQVSLLRVQGVAVGDGGCDGHLVVWVLFIHDAVVEQQPAVGLGAAPCKHRLPCTNINQSFHLPHIGEVSRFGSCARRNCSLEIASP